jgi:hypothetical protein
VTEEEFAELAAGNVGFELLERVAIVRRKDDGAVGIALLRKMPDGTVGDDGQPLTWRTVTYRLDPGVWETLQLALEDPARLRRHFDDARAVLLSGMEPAGRA